MKIRAFLVAFLIMAVAPACESSESRLRVELEEAHDQIDRLEERLRSCNASLSACEAERDDCDN